MENYSKYKWIPYCSNLHPSFIISSPGLMKRTGKIGTEAPQNSGRQTQQNNLAQAYYIAGLGYTGLGDKVKARAEFTQALILLPDYLNAKIALDQLHY